MEAASVVPSTDGSLQSFMRKTDSVPGPITSSIVVTVFAGMLTWFTADAQSLLPDGGESAASWTEERLSDLSGFANPSANWKIVGDVVSMRSVAGDLQTVPGSGYLVGASGEDLQTRWNHGDIELDFEVLIPAGTDTDLLLQGRYALSLSDSWGSTGTETPQLGTAGGTAPRVDVARAPGLWQHVNVLFRAPRFDGSRGKTGNAEFVRVAVNGVIVQDGVMIDTPSTNAVATDEAPEAPLVLRAGGGPIAYRNIRYRLLDGGPASVANVKYTYYRGDFGWEMPDVATLDAVGDGPAPQMSSTLADTSNRFVLQFAGDLLIPRSGAYLMEVTSTGQFTLEVDGKTVVDIESDEVAAVGDVPRRVATVNLAGGRHSFVLTYARGRWHRALSALGWYISGAQSIRTRLTAARSDPDAVFAEYQVEPEDRPRLQRNFVAFEDGKRTHAISVGYPGGNHYAYDTASGALLYIWRGRFIDTSTMWFSRGNDQSAAPRGSLITLSGEPTIRDVGGAAEDATYRFNGYRLDEAGAPEFSYSIGSLRVTDHISPEPDGRYLERNVTVTNTDGQAGGLVVLAEAARIRELARGAFDVGNGKYYVETELESVELESSAGVDRLVVRLNPAVPSTSVRYSIVW